MNPARTLGPNLVGGDLGPYWIYLAGPLLGAVAAVGLAYVLRGPGGGPMGSVAAQGVLYTDIDNPDPVIPQPPTDNPGQRAVGGGTNG